MLNDILPTIPKYSNLQLHQLKILHLPTAVGGNPQGLSRHLTLLGLNSTTMILQQNYFRYSADKIVSSDSDNLITTELKKIVALTYVFRYQVILFNYGSTLYYPTPTPPSREKYGVLHNFYPLWRSYTNVMQFIELSLLKLLRRKLFVFYQGDDARQGDVCRAKYRVSIANNVEAEYYSVESNKFKRKQIDLLTRRCVKTYALNPDLLDVLPQEAEFMPYCHISLEQWDPVYTQLDTKPLRIGHAPSHRGVKGTQLIIDAINRLKGDGHSFEFVVIEGLSNDAAMEVYKTLDVLVDQLFAGWYGGLAVEAMALGKPVVAFIRDDDLVHIPEQMRDELPIIRAEPSTIYTVLESVICMRREDLFLRAKASRMFVEKWHDPLAIAQRIKDDIEASLENQ